MADELLSIRIKGLRELNKQLRAISADAPKQLRLVNNEAATIVVHAAKPKIPNGPPQAGHAASSIKAASTRTAVRIKAGGPKFPYFPWLDFGGRVGRRKHSVRPFLKSGRYVWKSYADNREKVTQTLADGLKKVIADAGLDGG